MALLERLQILIDADGKGAVREFQKVGATADRELSRVEDRTQKMSAGLTTFGATAVTASAVAAVGLGKLAMTASDYGEAISASSVIFDKEAVPALEAYGEAAAEASGLSKTAAVDGANTFGAFGKAAGLAGDDLVGFSTDLVTLAGDMASFKNTTPEEAIEAIGAALRGESEPIRKYNVLLDDATLKQEALALGIYDGNGVLTQQQKVLAANASIFKQTNDIQGDYLRTSDSLANRQRNLAAEFENVQIKIGEGLIPLFETLSGVATGALDTFGSLPDGAQTGIGTIAGIGTVAIGSAGAVALIAAQGLKARDALTTVGTDGVRSLNNVGKAAKAAGLLTGAITIGFVLDELGKSETTQEMDRIAAASSDMNEAILRNFSSAGRNTKGFVDNFTHLSDSFIYSGDEYVGVLEDIDRAMGDAYKSKNFDELRKGITALREAAADPKNADIKDSILAVISDYEGKLGDAAMAASNFDSSWQGVIGSLTRGKTPTEKAAAATEDLATQTEDVGLNAKLAAVGLDAMSERASSFAKSLEGSTNIDDLLSAGLSYRGGLDGFFEKIGALPKELDVAKVALGGYTDAQHDALSVLAQAGDASQKYLTTLLEQGLGADNVRVMAAGMWDQYRKVFEQLGLNEEQTRQYQEILGLTPEQVETAINVSGIDEAIFKIETYSKLLEDEIPDSVKTQLLAQLEQGDLTGAAETYDAWVRFMQATAAGNPLILPTEVDTTPADAGLETWRRLTGQAPPADTPVGADTDPATSQVFLWRQLQASMAVEVPVKAKIDGSWRGVIGALTGGGGRGGLPTSIPTGQMQYPGFNGQGGADFNFLTPRAAGGPVNPNETYLVGEKGPEIFRPKMSGDIIPNHQIGVAAQQQPAGTVINIESVTTTSVEELPAEMSRSALRLKALLG